MRYWRTFNDEYGRHLGFDHDIKGYIFIRILERTSDSITTAFVADKSMRYLESADAVWQRISSTLNKRSFYSDTFHLYKVKGGDLSFEEAQQIANK